MVSKLNLVMNTGTSCLRGLHHLLAPLLTQRTGHCMRTRSNLKPPTFFFKLTRCPRPISTLYLSFGHGNRWSMDILVLLQATKRFTTWLMHHLREMHHGNAWKLQSCMTSLLLHQVGRRRSTRYGSAILTLFSATCSPTLTSMENSTQHHTWKLTQMGNGDGAISCQLISLGDNVYALFPPLLTRDPYSLLCWQDRIFNEDPTTKGAMYVAGILGSDKTTVSVATGDVEYHPFYLSPGNLHNIAHHGHRQGVIPISFFAIPKSKCSTFMISSVFYFTHWNQVIASMTAIPSSTSLNVNYFMCQFQQSFHRSRLQWRSQLFAAALMGIFAMSSMILVPSSPITLNRLCLWGSFKAGVLGKHNINLEMFYQWLLIRHIAM